MSLGLVFTLLEKENIKKISSPLSHLMVQLPLTIWKLYNHILKTEGMKGRRVRYRGRVLSWLDKGLASS